MGNFVLMPKLGMTMTEGKIVKWLSNEGDTIGKGDYIVEVETDKTVLEVDSLYSGKLLKIYFDEDIDVPVNTPIAFIGEEGELAPDAPAPESAVPTEIEKAKPTPSAMPVKNEMPKSAVKKIDTSQYNYGLIVVGAGPGGYVAAIRAAQLGAKVAVVDRGEVGGTCLNRGCIPTKALYTSAKVYGKLLHVSEYGLKADGVGFDWEKIMQRKDKIVKQLTTGVHGLFKNNGIDFLTGTANAVDAHTLEVDGRRLTGAYIMIATGAKPFSVLKNVDDGFDVMDTDDVLSMQRLPASMAIVGGGVVGVEMANIMAAFGVKVTIVEMMPSITPMVDEEASVLLTKALRAKGVDIKTGVTVTAIRKTDVGARLELSDGSAVDCEAALEAVGRRADTSGFEALGLKTDAKGFIEIDASMRTNIENVYAVGDVTGGYMLAHEASKQGEIAVETIFGEYKEQPILIPSCVFTEPEIAFVGLTEQAAKEQGYETKVFKFPFVANGKALTLGEYDGFVKVVADTKYGEILGVHIVGPEASSLIHEAAMAMNMEATAEFAGRVAHAHPTLAEALMEAFLGVNGEAVHI